MLRYPERQPNRAPRMDDRSVVSLPNPDALKSVPPGEKYSERIARTREEVRIEDEKISRIAQAYVDAAKHYGVGQSLTYARANDRALRTLLRNPLRDVTSTKVWFSKLSAEVNKQLVADSKLDPEARSKSIKRCSETVAKSFDQLLPFIDSVRKFSPGDMLATGVELDVDLGIDLMRVSTNWDEASSQLTVEIDLYQAKAGMVSNIELQKLAKDYLEEAKKATALLLDDNWFGARGREQAGSFYEPMHHDRSLDSLLGEPLPETNIDLTPLGRLFQRDSWVKQLNDFATEMGEPQVAGPTLVLKRIDYRLLTRNEFGKDIDISIFDVPEYVEQYNYDQQAA